MRPHPILPLALLAVLSATASAAPPRSPIRCGTPERLPGLDRTAPPPVALGGATKVTRDAFGGTHSVRESDNFAVKWQSTALTDAQAQVVLDALERGWMVFAALGHGVPTGADTYRMNAYVHGPTDNPPIDFEGGYATIDEQGYPYFVISNGLFEYGDEVVEAVAVHELYHDYQMSLPAFQPESTAWFWESTAEWAAQEVYPMSTEPYYFLASYAFAAELALFSFGGDDQLSGGHPYGASIFERYLTDRVDDPTLIARAWTGGGADDDPLVVLDGLLAGGVAGGLPAVFAEFAPHNPLWDYPQRDLLIGWIEEAAMQFPGRDVHATVGPDGTGDFQTIPPDRALHAWGYHVIALERPADGTVELALELDAAGSAGTAASWSATLVADPGGGPPGYTPVPLAGATGELSATLPEGAQRHYLVVTVTGDGRDAAETFGYRYRVGAAAEPAGPDAGAGDEAEDESGGGCCSAGGGGSGSALLALIVILCTLRRHDAAGRRSRRPL
jgi:hypothetical protein